MHVAEDVLVLNNNDKSESCRERSISTPFRRICTTQWHIDGGLAYLGAHVLVISQLVTQDAIFLAVRETSQVRVVAACRGGGVARSIRGIEVAIGWCTRVELTWSQA